MNLEQEILQIKKRNLSVESDKAWEISFSRKICVLILTYIVIVLFFIMLDLPKPFLNAIVPSLGFVISTMSLSVLKKIWIKFIYKK